MPKLSDLPTGPPSILIYGPLGTGKTVLATTLGKHLKVYDLNNGLLSARTLNDKFKADRAQIEVKQFVCNTPSVGTVFTELRSELLLDFQAAVQGKFPYKAVCLDALTDLCDAAMRMVLGGHVGPPQLQHWGLAFDSIKSVIQTMKLIPGVIKIVIGHEMIDELDGQSIRSIGVQGKNLPGQLMSMFDEIWYAKVQAQAGGKQAFVLQTRSTSAVKCRTRANLPDPVDQNIGMVAILKQMGFDLEAKT